MITSAPEQQLAPSAPAPEQPQSILAGRVASHGVIYLLSSVLTLAAGVASVVVVTNFLDTADFGRLAVLSTFASIITLVINAGVLQGTTSLAFGMSISDEGDVFDADDKAPQRPHAVVAGLVLTALLGLILAALSFVFAKPLGGLLIHRKETRDLIFLSGIAGSVSGLWRVAVNLLRVQRRPWAYLVGRVAHPVLQLAATVPLLVAGGGLHGAVLGMCIGSSAATAFCLTFSRGSLKIGFSLRDAKAIYARGWPYLPIAAGTHIIQVADVFLVSRFVPFGDVGLYRVATRVGALSVHCTSAFNMAWGTMRGDALYHAARARYGAERLGATVVTYFAAFVGGVVLVLAVFANEAVRIAAPSYAHATSYIPLATLAASLHGAFVIVYFTSDFNKRRPWFALSTLVAAGVFVATSLFWIPLMGPNGASVAVMCGFTAGGALVLFRGQRGPHPVPFQIKRIATVIAAAGACYAVTRIVDLRSRGLHDLLGLAVVLAYPAILLSTGIVPRHHVRRFLTVVRTRRRDTWRAVVRRRLEAMDPADQALLGEVATLGTTAAKTDHELLRCVDLLRVLAGVTPSMPSADLELAACLTSKGPYGERHAQSTELFDEGLDPLEYDALERALKVVRRQLRHTSLDKLGR